MIAIPQGFRIGNAHDEKARTGVTVVLAEPACSAGVDVRGGGPGTRETDLLAPGRLVERVDAIVLTGGSVFGLDAASGATRFLAKKGRGFRAGPAICPIVPAAVLFDLANGGAKDWDAPPYGDLAIRACERAFEDAPLRLGKVGAGYGARAGRYEGGLGWAASAVARGDKRYAIAAIAAVNCAGSPVMPGLSSFWAWPFERDGELGGQPVPARAPDHDLGLEGSFGENTTLVAVLTDAALDKAQCSRIASAAHDGFARAIRPVHLPIDGDVAFAMASAAAGPLEDPVMDMAALMAAAADVTARAIAKGVYEAVSLGGHPCYQALHGAALRR